MALPLRIHTCVAGDTLTAAQLEAEFNIAAQALTLGTKDANVSALTAASLTVTTISDFTGNVNAAANVNIGDSSSDTMKVNAVSVFNNSVTINAATTVNAASSFNAAITLNAAANITGSVNVSANANINGNLVVGGNSTLGDAAADTLLINASSTINNVMTFVANIAGSPNVTGTMTAGNVSTAGSLVIGSIAATSANIVAAAVTRATGVSVGTGGVAISTSSGSFSTANTSYINVTNLTATITTSGRPVYLGLIANTDTTVAGGYIQLDISGATTLFTKSQFYRNAVAISNEIISELVTNTSATETEILLSYPCGAMTYIDTPTAGTYVYTLKTKVNDASGTVQFNHCRLIAYEL